MAGPPLGDVGYRAGEGVEDTSAGATAVIENRVAMTAVHPKSIIPATMGTAQTIGVQRLQQTSITSLFVHEIGNWEIHDGSSVSSRHCTTITSSRQRPNTAGGT